MQGIINIAVFSNCTCILQLLQILIVSLLMLYINIVGVVTSSDNYTHITQFQCAATPASQYKKKTKI